MKRISINLLRKPWKSIILVSIIFFIGIISVTSIIVSQAIYNAELLLRNRMKPIVSIQQTGETFPDFIITPDVVSAIGELQYVYYYDYILRGHHVFGGIRMDSHDLDRKFFFTKYIKFDINE